MQGLAYEEVLFAVNCDDPDEIIVKVNGVDGADLRWPVPSSTDGDLTSARQIANICVVATVCPAR